MWRERAKEECLAVSLIEIKKIRQRYRPLEPRQIFSYIRVKIGIVHALLVRQLQERPVNW